MTDQITVPRATWDALQEALKLCYEHCRVYHPEVDTNNVGQSVRQALTAANAVSVSQFVGCAYCESNGACCESGEPCKADVHNDTVVQPQAQGEAKTYAPSRQRVVMACDILDRIKEAHENWGGWSGTPSSCDAAINLLRYPANMPVNAAQPQATESRKLHECTGCGHLYDERLSSCDCMENPGRTYNDWVATPAAPEAKQ